MNTDQLNSVPAWHTLQTAYCAVDSMQDKPAAQRVAAVAVLFHETCTALRLDPSEMLDKARRISRHAEDAYSLELGALRTYIRKES